MGQKMNKNSRRNFIRTGFTLATGLYILPRHVLGGPGYVAPSDKLQIAGIGVGGKGESDIWNFFKGGRADIAILCDVDEKRASKSRERFPKAKFYHDYREMLEKEHKNIDAVSVSGPDHVHAIQALAAMQLGKHVYVQKPLTHTIQEARILTQAAERYKVVTQMGNQGASGEGVRRMQEWCEAGLIGDVHTVYVFTDRPVWPQGIPWPAQKAQVPSTLKWDLWLGPAPYRDYIEKLIPFNWRGWWDFGTGALGDMGCHLMEAPFKILGLGYPYEATCSVGSVYVDEFRRGYFPESCPPSSHVVIKFRGKAGKQDLKMVWMDGGIQPERPEELGPADLMGDGGNAIIMVGSKGKIVADVYGANPRLLPKSLMEQGNNVPKILTRVAGGEEGHYTQWVDACIAGYGSKEYKDLSAPFSISGPLTETVLMGNLAIRSFDIRKPRKDNPERFDYPGRYISLLWDGAQMKVTNFDDANQFVTRSYRSGFELKV
ncbi:MAG TPA: Gfo/Idh/MocA family oxidoreductase [Phnomibacter sp.]|nr:Gfo/Idh/MocA family oxidoreductase [Phnomibacter sp.]